MICRQHGTGHLHRVDVGESRQGNAGVIGAVSKRMGVAWPVGTEAEHAAGGNAICHIQQKFFCGFIYPVEILKTITWGRTFGGPQEQLSQGVEDFGAPQLRLHGAHGRLARIDGEQRAQIGENGLQLGTELQDALGDLVDDGSFGIFFEAEVASEQVDQRMKRHRLPKRHGVPFEPGSVCA